MKAKLILKRAIVIALFVVGFTGTATAQYYVADTFKFSLGDKTPAHPFYDVGDDIGYLVNGVEGGTIHMIRDSVYAFVHDGIRQTDGSIFAMSPRGEGRDQYNKGRIGENPDCNCRFFRLPPDAPDTLYYVSGESGWAGGMILVADSLVSSVEEMIAGTQDHSIAMSSVVPNPVVTTATLSFVLRESTCLQVEVYDVVGRMVQSSNFASASGQVEARISGENLLGGIYFYRVLQDDGELLTTGSFNVLSE